MDQQQHIDEKLWQYLDGSLPVSEKTAVEQLLRENSEWRATYESLLSIHQSLQTIPLESPSLRFQKNVMEEIARLQITPAARSYLNKKIIWSLGVFFITLLVGFVVYSFSQVQIKGDHSNDKSWLNNLDKLDFSRLFNNNWVNGFMLINVVLGLVLLDHYFNNKRKKYTSTL